MAEEPPEEADPLKLPEIVRLAVLVTMLDAENAIAPAGALCMLSTGAVKENTAYAGAPARPTCARQRSRRSGLAQQRSRSAALSLSSAPPPGVLPQQRLRTADATADAPPTHTPLSPCVAGLSSASAGSIGSYVFANKPKPKDVLAPSMVNALDFLTPADAVVPKGALCAHLDESTGVTTIRNLLWPGFVSFTSPGKQWGYCYFGTGEKNADIAFMLP